MSAAHWDCHAHLFGPYARFSLAADRSYTPPEAVEAQYLALLKRLGMEHGVLVHPSAYGYDHSLVLAALAAQPKLRGVLVARPGELMLQGLRDRGVRALRYSQRGTAKNFAGSASFTDLQAMAPALADAGLHAELWTDCTVLPTLVDAIRALPKTVPVVIDHMAGFDVTAGVDEPGFRCLLDLLSEGRVWVKLCAYRNLMGLPDPSAWAEALRPFQQALQLANSAQLVWGTDWPHLNIKKSPDAAELLLLLRDTVDDAALCERILANNPASLYA